MRQFARLGLIVALGGLVPNLQAQDQGPTTAAPAAPAPAAGEVKPAATEPKKEEKKEEAKKADDKKVERIVVTGTHIRKIDTESVSNVKVIDKKEVEKSGQSSVADFVQTLSVSAEGSYSSASVNDSRGTVSQVNLRGLGAQNTLVLLDGRRLPDEGGEGVVDLSVIPMAAIERIDVLLDSASAIYGSDATGGVINIITRKNYSGATFLARGTKNSEPGGEERIYNMVTGTSNDKYSTLTTLSYRHVEPVFYRQRDWTKVGVSTYAFPANYQTIKDGAWHKSPNCPADNDPIKMRDGSEGCSYNYGATSAFSPESTQISVLNNSEYKITKDLSLFASITAARNVNKWNMAPNAGEFTISKDDIAAHPNVITNLGIPTENTEDGILINYRTLPWGLRTWEEDNTSLGATVGLKGELGDAWNWEVAASNVRGKKFSMNPQGFLRKDDLVDAISSGTYNPFVTDLDSGTAGVVDQLTYQPFVVTTTEMRTYNALLSGEAFSLPGGPIGIAVGVSRAEQDYAKLIDHQSEQGRVFGVEEDRGDSGSRDVDAIFAELGLPVMKGLDLQLAARHDRYSDFGSTTNPKFGVSYRPVNYVLLRANWSTGFKAPTLKDIFRGQTVGLANVQDKPTCRAAGTSDDDCPLTTEIRTIYQGNRNLKEERSVTYNGGVAFEPIAGNSLSFDYWHTQIKDIVSTVDAQDLLDAIADGRSGFGNSTVTRDAAGNLSEIHVETLNLGTKKEAGYDVNLDLSAQLADAHRVGFASEYAAKAFSKVVKVPGAPETDELGDRGKPKWRLTNKATYGISSHALSLSQNIIAKQKTQDKQDFIGSYTTYNANYTYTHPWNGSVSVGALNLLNKDFPMDMSERPGDDRRVKELFGPNGRTVYAQLTQSF